MIGDSSESEAAGLLGTKVWPFVTCGYRGRKTPLDYGLVNRQRLSTECGVSIER